MWNDLTECRMTEGEATSHGHTFREGPTFLRLGQRYGVVRSRVRSPLRELTSLVLDITRTAEPQTRDGREAQAQTYRLSVVCVFDDNEECNGRMNLNERSTLSGSWRCDPAVPARITRRGPARYSPIKYPQLMIPNRFPPRDYRPKVRSKVP